MIVVTAGCLLCPDAGGCSKRRSESQFVGVCCFKSHVGACIRVCCCIRGWLWLVSSHTENGNDLLVALTHVLQPFINKFFLQAFNYQNCSGQFEDENFGIRSRHFAYTPRSIYGRAVDSRRWSFCCFSSTGWALLLLRAANGGPAFPANGFDSVRANQRYYHTTRSVQSGVWCTSDLWQPTWDRPCLSFAVSLVRLCEQGQRNLPAVDRPKASEGRYHRHHHQYRVAQIRVAGFG